MKLAVSFLGTGEYKETKYNFEDKQFQTSLFTASLPVFFPALEQVCVFATEKANKQRWVELEEKWPRDKKSPALKRIDIPEGKSENELWMIFDAIVENIPEKSSLVFDLTHGFRSLPIVSLLAIAYLKSAKEITLERLVYGAYEAGDKEKQITPVFDLTSMVSLLDWLSVYERFAHGFDSEGLSVMLRQIQGNAYRGKCENPPCSLQNFGNKLSNFTGALNLGRVKEVISQAASIRNAAKDSIVLKEAINWAKPLQQILPLVDNVAGQIGQAGKDDLQAYLNLVKLYVERGLYMQAISLIREWIVSHVCQEFNAQADIYDRDIRRQAEDGLNYIADKKTGKEWMKQPVVNIPAALLERHADLWIQVREIRNDVDHLGFNKQPLTTDKIIKQIKKCLDKIFNFQK